MTAQTPVQMVIRIHDPSRLTGKRVIAIVGKDLGTDLPVMTKLAAGLFDTYRDSHLWLIHGSYLVISSENGSSEQSGRIGNALSLRIDVPNDIELYLLNPCNEYGLLVKTLKKALDGSMMQYASSNMPEIGVWGFRRMQTDLEACIDRFLDTLSLPKIRWS